MQVSKSSLRAHNVQLIHVCLKALVEVIDIGYDDNQMHCFLLLLSLTAFKGFL